MVEELLKPQEVGDSRGLVLFILGVILGLGAMFSMYYFFGHCSGSESISTLIGSGGSGSSGNGSSNSGLSSGTTIFKDSAGNILTVENGDNSKTSTFVDSTGKRRGITCYTSIYCIEDCVDCNKTNEPCEDCVKENDLCGYGTGFTSASVTDLQSQTPPFYGRCCDDLECVSGRCKRDQCVPENGLCDSGPTSYVQTSVAVDYGDCCGTYQCTNGYCKPPTQQCREKGQSCDFSGTVTSGPSAGTCCGDLVCTNNVCNDEPTCGEGGDPCTISSAISYNPNADSSTSSSVSTSSQGSCCSGFICQPGTLGSLNGFCQPKQCQTSGTCKTDGDCCSPDYYCGQVGVTAANLQCIKKCQGTGSTCSINSDCCPGTSCTDGTCQAPCGREKAYCGDGDNGVECCETYTCSSTSFTCTAQGDVSPPCMTSGPCTEDTDCCSNTGFVCDDGQCTYQQTTPPTQDCYQIGYTCTSDGQCCSDICDNNHCSSERTPTCADYDQPCGPQGGGATCCSPHYCDTGFGVCKGGAT